MDSSRFRSRKLLTPEALVLAAMLLPILGALVRHAGAQGAASLSAPFERRVLAAALPEAPFHLRFFTTAVKTDSEGRIITGPTDDPVKNLVGAEPAGVRAGLERYTKILFGAGYIDGWPDPGTRIDPNSPEVKSGNQHWPPRSPRATATSTARTRATSTSRPTAAPSMWPTPWATPSP